jgi:hypothetical protein
MAITDLVPIPGSINPGLENATQATMLALLGSPRQNFSDACQPITNADLARLVKTESVGPFRATGLQVALLSLRAVLDDIGREAPEAHAALGSAGMLCARFVRGSAHMISNHAWGTAIDLRLNALLDRRGDNRVQLGLVQIAPIFNRHGWYWGAGFRTEDAMHFEASEQLIRRWSADGALPRQLLPPRVLSMGDRGPEVVALQRALNKRGSKLKDDGVFGPGTRAAVIAFEAAAGLMPDGVVGPETRKALGLE